MRKVWGKFLVNDATETPNIMGLDILRQVGIVINGQKGTWNFEKSDTREKVTEEKAGEHFVELGDKIFQTVEITGPDHKREVMTKTSPEELKQEEHKSS